MTVHGAKGLEARRSSSSSTTVRSRSIPTTTRRSCRSPTTATARPPRSSGRAPRAHAGRGQGADRRAPRRLRGRVSPPPLCRGHPGPRPALHLRHREAGRRARQAEALAQRDHRGARGRVRRERRRQRLRDFRVAAADRQRAHGQRQAGGDGLRPAASARGWPAAPPAAARRAADHAVNGARRRRPPVGACPRAASCSPARMPSSPPSAAGWCIASFSRCPTSPRTSAASARSSTSRRWRRKWPEADRMRAGRERARRPWPSRISRRSSRPEAAPRSRSPESIGAATLSGRIDRLAVTADRVLIVDYKTNRPAPEAVADAPHDYVMQLALYRAVLRRLYPQKAGRCGNPVDRPAVAHGNSFRDARRRRNASLEAPRAELQSTSALTRRAAALTHLDGGSYLAVNNPPESSGETRFL